MKKVRGFEIAKGWEDKGIHIPIRKTAHSAGYDIEAAEDTDFAQCRHLHRQHLVHLVP